MTVILTLEVRGAQASALGASARMQFGPDGGVIGRHTACDWILPNEKVSARHAVIRFADGVFFLEDKSTNGVFVNNKRERLVRGRAHALHSGDMIFIEPYEIRVTVSGAPAMIGRAGPDWDAGAFEPTSSARRSADDPFADPFAADPFASTGAVRPDLGVSDEAASNRELDPLKLIGGTGPRPAAPRRPEARDLEGASPIAAHYKPPAMRPPPDTPPPPPAPVQIPEDYDPLADSGVTPLRDAGRPRTGSKAEGDPGEAASLRAGIAARPEEPWDASIHSISLAPEVPDVPPPSADPIAIATPLADSTVALDAMPGLLDDDQSSAPAAGPASEPVPVDLAPLPAAAIATSPPLARSTPPPSRAAEPAPADSPLVSGDLAAILAGAGLEGAEVTDELARDFGRILRVVVAGVMDVLRARQQIKDEFRMRMTQFRPADNNPLKFSANVEDALHNLLVKRNAAYLSPVEAFEDAFDDVRGHQLAMLAGMRVAFETMLTEFNPDRLQDQFDRQLKKGSLLTVPAKLRYWEIYRDYCEGLQKDSESAFRKLFGEAFAKAYEDQLNRLRAERPARRRDA